MGIHGLLPLLKSVTEPVHVKSYAGKKVAVDTYSWLHKGAISCSKDLVEGNHNPRFVDYCMHRVKLLQHNGVIPVMVFDGGLLPMKSDQEHKRSRSRKENLMRAEEHERAGNTSAAYECYQKALDITPAIAHKLIQVLRKENVEFIVAPYEADAQMTYLSKNGLVHAVITEDSDMLVYGCPIVLYKMDKFGQGFEIRAENLHRNKDLNLATFTPSMILEMCVLSGCDYLPSLPGLGVKRAYALIRRFKSYKKVIKSLIFSGIPVPRDYEDKFRKALLTFNHQKVFDPRSKSLVHLNPVDESCSENLDFVGPDLPEDVAVQIAFGILDPFTMELFQGENLVRFEAQKEMKAEKSCLEPFRSQRKRKGLPLQKNNLSKYFVPVSASATKKFKPPRVSTAAMDDLRSSFKLFDSQSQQSFTVIDSESQSQRSLDLESQENKENKPGFQEDPIEAFKAENDNLFSESEEKETFDFDWGLSPSGAEDSSGFDESEFEKKRVESDPYRFSSQETGLSPDWRTKAHPKPPILPKKGGRKLVFSSFFESANLPESERRAGDVEAREGAGIPPDQFVGSGCSKEDGAFEEEEASEPLKDSEGNGSAFKTVQFDSQKLLEDPSFSEFSTNVSHVREYAVIGQTAVNNLERRLGEFRHLPPSKARKQSEKSKMKLRSSSNSQQSFDDFAFSPPF